MAKTLVGVVASDKADKTIVVSVVTRKTHPLYKKQYTSTKRFMAHDEKNEAKEGDRVQISEVKPMSARKHFSLEKILERASVHHVETIDEEVAEVAGLKDKEESKEAPAEEEK